MQRSNGTSPRRNRSRGGYLYVSVMAVSFIVGVMAFSAIHVARLQTRGASGETDRQHARSLAAAAIELATARFNTDSNWQTTYAVGTLYPATPVAVNGGTLQWRLVALGGGTKRLDGVGRKGNAECVLSVDLGGPPVALDAPLISQGTFGLPNGTNSLTVVGGPLVSNGIAETAGPITGNVEAQTIDVYGGGSISGTRTAPGTIRVLPSPKKVFPYYTQVGTKISNGSIANGSDLLISGQLLSPASNPYGFANANGVYWIDAAGKSLVIRNCRIVGTLVVINVTSPKEVILDGALNWEPAHPHYPALLVEGNLHVQFAAAVLSETLLLNFNPLGTPYKGSTDVLGGGDDYPSALAGILYASGNVRFNGLNLNRVQKIQGVVIAGGTTTVNNKAHVTVTFDGTFATTPPPGFASGGPASIVPGSWRQTSSN